MIADLNMPAVGESSEGRSITSSNRPRRTNRIASGETSVVMGSSSSRCGLAMVEAGLVLKIEVQELRDQLKALYTEEEKTRAWAETTGIVKTYSDEMIRRWKEEIDTLLVYVRVPFSSSLNPTQN